MGDGTTREGWWPIASLSAGSYEFDIQLEDYDLYRTWSLAIPFDLAETDPHPTMGEDYRVATREYAESEGQKAESIHLEPPPSRPGSAPNTTGVESDRVQDE